MERRATNRVDRCHLDDLVQRKHVKIHKVHWGNKWMGSSDFGALNKTTSQTAGWGLKTKQDNKIEQQTNMKKQVNTSCV